MARALLGLAFGDALGNPVEGLPAPEARRRVERGLWRPEETTDDTALALLTAEVLAASGRFDRGPMVRALVEMGPAPRMGPTTRRALERLGRDPTSDASGGATNGAAVRCLPLGILHREPDLLEEAVERCARITHGAEGAVDAARMVARAVSAGIETGSRKRAVEAAREAAGSLEPALREALRTDPARLADHFALTIEAAESVPAAVALYARARDPVREAVALGGDADTVAALAGALLGATHPERIPAGGLRHLPEFSRLQRAEGRLLELRAGQRG